MAVADIPVRGRKVEGMCKECRARPRDRASARAYHRTRLVTKTLNPSLAMSMYRDQSGVAVLITSILSTHGPGVRTAP